jgi:hypothetical protein
MDAYDIYNRLKEEWQKLAKMPQSDLVNKVFDNVSVYANVNGELHKVKAIDVKDNKIILETDE